MPSYAWPKDAWPASVSANNRAGGRGRAIDPEPCARRPRWPDRPRSARRGDGEPPSGSARRWSSAHRALRAMLMKCPGNPVAGAVVVVPAAGRAAVGVGAGEGADFTTTMLPISRPECRAAFAAPGPAVRSRPMAAPTTESVDSSPARADAPMAADSGPRPPLALASLVATSASWPPAGGAPHQLGLGCRLGPLRRHLHPDREGPWHGAVEDSNRVLTPVLFIAVVAVFVAAFGGLRRATPRRQALGVGHLAGRPGPGVIGGVVTLTQAQSPGRSPPHFLVSMMLDRGSTALWWRTRQPAGRGRAGSAPASRAPDVGVRLGEGLTRFSRRNPVTGTGPHAGEQTAKRFISDPQR